MPQLLSPCATTTDARMPRARAPQQRQATAMRSPHTTTKSSPTRRNQRKPAHSNKDQRSQKKKKDHHGGLHKLSMCLNRKKLERAQVIHISLVNCKPVYMCRGDTRESRGKQIQGIHSLKLPELQMCSPTHTQIYCQKTEPLLS